jgi:hypothetical protein
MMEKVVMKTKKENTKKKMKIKCLLNTKSLHKIFFSNNFTKLRRLIGANKELPGRSSQFAL